MAELLATQSRTEQTPFNWEHRAYEDAATWAAEALEGNMRTTFRYRFNGKELFSEDGGALAPIFEDALLDAKRTVVRRPNLAFEVRRRMLEREEYRDMLQMAAGQAPNTLITVSDYPTELMDYPGEFNGYNGHRKQTMLRVITRNPDGNLTMHSQSLDRSDRAALEAVYGHFGLRPEPGELLGQRIKAEVPVQEQGVLIDRLMGIYDAHMSEQYGGEWYAGRSNGERHNTYLFVKQQTDLLAAVVDGQSKGMPLQDLYYNLAAALEERSKPAFVSRRVLAPAGDWKLEQALTEMQQAGHHARASGKSFSGCGATLRAQQEQSAGAELKDAGFGNSSEKEEKYSFNLKTYCRVCQKPPKWGEPKKMCGPCAICRDCDTKLRKK